MFHPGNICRVRTGRDVIEANQSFTVTVVEQHGAVVMRSDGDLDLASEGQWAAGLAAAIRIAQHNIVVDLDAVTFMGCSGLSLIVDAWQKSTALGLDFAVANHHDMVDRLGAATGVFDAINQRLP